ncbi:MAG: hypothetical protein AAGA48_32545 [Myxococcota bacterium]
MTELDPRQVEASYQAQATEWLVRRLGPDVEADLLDTLRESLGFCCNDFGRSGWRKLMSRGPIPVQWLLRAAYSVFHGSGVSAGGEILLELLAETGRLGALAPAMERVHEASLVAGNAQMQQFLVHLQRFRDRWLPTASRLEWSRVRRLGKEALEPWAKLLEDVSGPAFAPPGAWHVLADWLEAFDPERAKVLRAELDDDTRHAWVTREAWAYPRFTSPNGVQASFDRGFLDWVPLGDDPNRLAVAERALDVPEGALLDKLVIEQPGRLELDALADDRWSGLRHLRLRGRLHGLGGLRTRIARGLQSLQLVDGDEMPSIIEAMGQAPAVLDDLSLVRMKLTDEGFERLCKTSVMTNVRRLRLDGNRLTPQGLGVLAEQDCPLVELSIAHIPLGLEGWSALQQAPWARRLRRLRLTGTDLPVPEILQGIQHFPYLEDVTIRVPEVSPELERFLAEPPRGLKVLRWCGMGGVRAPKTPLMLVPETAYPAMQGERWAQDLQPPERLRASRAS